MRKIYVVFFCAVLLFISFFVGVYIYKLTHVDDALLARLKARSEEIQNDYAAMYLPTVSHNDVKLSPNARLVFRTEYVSCGHVLNEYKGVLSDEVNMTEEDLKKKYSEWTITVFDEKEAVLEKTVKGACGQHFVIREKDGNLAVYIIGENDEERLDKETSISTKYLTEMDLMKLENGIRVNGLEELNAILEDFE